MRASRHRCPLRTTLLATLGLAGCGRLDFIERDGGRDAPVDASSDLATDTATGDPDDGADDVPSDLSMDTANDLGTDVPTDITSDVDDGDVRDSRDATIDGSSDGSFDAALDTELDAVPDVALADVAAEPAVDSAPDVGDTGVFTMCRSCSRPTTSEVCDAVDNDCDGIVDNAPACDAVCGYRVSFFGRGYEWTLCEGAVAGAIGITHGCQALGLENAAMDRADATFVASEIQALGLLGVFGTQSGMIPTALSDEACEGDWWWVGDRAAPVGTLPWGALEPNNIGGGEHCANQIVHGNTLGFGLGDLIDNVACTERAFVCRRPLAAAPVPCRFYGTEQCDGLDNNCDSSVDETGCPARTCTGVMAGGLNFRYCTDALRWSAARASCEAQGMVLAKFPDVSTQTTLLGAIPVLDYWIGASDFTASRDWRWTDGTNANGVSRWGGMEPNNQREHCAMLLPGTGLWNDAICGALRPYLCSDP